jgi:hypothetical protein
VRYAEEINGRGVCALWQYARIRVCCIGVIRDEQHFPLR